MEHNLDILHPLNNLSTDVLKSTFEASRSPLIVTDYKLPDNPIIYSNQAFLDLTGYTMDEIIGKNCRFLQGPDSEAEAVSTLRLAVKKGESARVTLKNYTKTGVPFWNDLVLSPIRNAKGETTHFMGMQLDVTERVEAEQRLRNKSEELEQSNHQLEQFTYATSHDLQEPLRMVNSYVQLLSKRYGPRLDNDARTFLSFAAEGAERMQDLINDLLTLSRVSNDNDRFKLIAMRVVVDRATANLKAAIEEVKPDIHIGELPQLYVDPVQLTQLFQNLIGNAIKYRRSNVPVKIDISAEKRGGEYVFSVADNGIGIAKQHHERVFVIFQRLHTRSEYPGTGIGLAICSKIMERHGGRIWVESAEGSGATFKFSIPIIERS